ncbi:hypothetical protein HJC23_003097 [Cyclotella cryptica]|uniref:Uncharacterized protein n=1 Tax=Cyclotella cryptica TaxID=29204 RepID=A0ABD3P6J6_9STRA
MVIPKDQMKNDGCVSVNNERVSDSDTNNEQVDATSIYRRQSTGSFTAHTSGNDTANALALISDMLATYNDMIEKNTNTIKENAAIQDANFAALRSTLESIIDAVNGITLRALNLENAARNNTETLAALNDGMTAGTNMAGHGRFDDFQRQVAKLERDISEIKDSDESTSESIDIIERRLGSLESRLSKIERLLMKYRKHNDVAAKMA